jgi:lipopolysaccharide/colanic/teichoic acid biosynthesis glycosyltransferase
MSIEAASVPSVMTITSADTVRMAYLRRVGQGGVVALQSEKEREPSGLANSPTAGRSFVPVFRLVPAAERMVDITAATLGLLLFSPILLMASIAIKLDSRGPILVRETWYGYRNRPIQLLRFRLATASADNDRTSPRLTRIGRVLSQSRIDELPRLVNVLWGEMSIFGPPPHRYPKTTQHRIKPGIIRWAQTVATRDQRPDTDPH